MADSLLNTLASIRLKITALETKLRQEQETAHALRQQVDELTRAIAEKDKELAKARSDAEFLIYSHRLADNPDTIVETRRQIAKMIRDIDRCIDMLKD